MSWTGSPSASNPMPFTIEASDVLSGKNGILFYGLFGETALPFAGGTLCVTPPLQRTSVQATGGTPPPAVDCSGRLSFDFNELFDAAGGHHIHTLVDDAPGWRIQLKRIDLLGADAPLPMVQLFI